MNPLTAAQTQLADALGIVKDPARRPQALRQLLRAWGEGVTRCSRCAGSGRYGPHHIDGARCWGCNGWGVHFNVTDETLPELLAKVPELLPIAEHMKARRCTYREARAALLGHPAEHVRPDAVKCPLCGRRWEACEEEASVTGLCDTCEDRLTSEEPSTLQ